MTPATAAVSCTLQHQFEAGDGERIGVERHQNVGITWREPDRVV